MTELDDATRHALLRREAPPPGVEQRVLAALRARLGPGGPDGGGEPGSGLDAGLEPAAETAGTGSGGLAYAAKIVAATLALTSVGLLAVGGVGRAIVRERSSSPSTQPTLPAKTSIEHPSSDSSTSVIVPTEPTTIASEPPSPAPARPPSHSPTVTQPSAAAPPSSKTTLDAELALLRAARNAATPSAALVQLEQHREQFPTGVLADEREALRIDTLCRLGRMDEGSAAKQDFLATRSSSPLRARVRDACPRAVESIMP